MTKGFYNPVYTWKENKFILFERKTYKTPEDAMNNAVADGLDLMAEDISIGVCSEAFFIPMQGSGMKARLRSGEVRGRLVGWIDGSILEKGEFE